MQWNKKNKIMPSVTTWMDLEGTMLSEVSQEEISIYHMISLICGIQKRQNKQKIKINKHN